MFDGLFDLSNGGINIFLSTLPSFNNYNDTTHHLIYISYYVIYIANYVFLCNSFLFN